MVRCKNIAVIWFDANGSDSIHLYLLDSGIQNLLTTTLFPTFRNRVLYTL